jgi:hypothetical protein
MGRPAGDLNNCLNNIRTGDCSCNYFRSRRYHANYHGRRNYHHDNHHNQRQ